MKTFDDCFVKLGDMLTIEQNLLNEKANLFGHTDGSLSAILDKIGKYYEKNEEYSQASKFYRKSYLMRDAILGKYNYWTTYSHRHYMECEENLRKKSDVRTLCYYSWSTFSFGNYYENNEQYDKARKFYRTSFLLWESALKKDDYHTKYTYGKFLQCDEIHKEKIRMKLEQEKCKTIENEKNLELVLFLEEFPDKKNYLLKSYNVCLHLGNEIMVLKFLFSLGFSQITINQAKAEIYFLKFFGLCRKLFPDYQEYFIFSSMNTLEIAFEKLGELADLWREKENFFREFLYIILSKVRDHYFYLFKDYSNAYFYDLICYKLNPTDIPSDDLKSIITIEMAGKIEEMENLMLNSQNC